MSARTRTLAELAAEAKAITKDADVLWKKVWQPKFEKTTTQEEFWKVASEMRLAANIEFTDDLPGLLSVNLIFEMSALRERMKVASVVKSSYGDDDFKPGY